LASHYAPRATVRLMPALQLQAALDLLGADAKNMAVYARHAVRTARAVSQRRMPDDAQQAAQELFAVLRELDATGVRLIWVETPPDGLAWDGVRDRLQRAAA
jgi:L-threonylcarbamoyladenylate synthase